MNILFLQSQPCIRALKYAIGLTKRGHSLSFAYTGKTLSEFYGIGDELFQKWIKLEEKRTENSIDLSARGQKQLVELLESGKFDLIHSHNAPDYLTVEAIDRMRFAKKGIPIIHDNHDIITMRKTPYGKRYTNILKVTNEERIANIHSDARIYVSEGLENYAKENYGSKGEFDLVFPNFVPEDLVPKKLLPKISEKDGKIHIVYEGTVDEKRSGAHYDLLDIFDDITSRGFHMHVYTTREATYYKELSKKNNLLHFHGRKNPRDLIKELTQYDFGWAGFNGSRNIIHLNSALPNKLMEYISAGLPVITFPHTTQKKFLEEKGIGFCIENISELEQKIKEENIEEIKKEVKRRRFDFTVEKNIGIVDNFYQKLVESF
jgi:glycosyltransferase involved in cell wall biosynthesis